MINNKPKNVISHFSPITSHKGVSLIALIVTVMVTIILAGVSISLFTGNNPISGKVGQAKNSYEMASQNAANRANELVGILAPNGRARENNSSEPVGQY